MKLFTVLVVALLGLSACNMIGGGTSKPTSLYTGTNGVTIAFLQGAPADKIYEGRPFPVKFQLNNLGAKNVTYKNMLITFSWDPLYITGGLTPYTPETFDKVYTDIKGKSLEYPQGQRFSYSIPTEFAFAAKPVYGQRESPKTTLTANICYAYTTFAATEVCIDTNIYDENVRKQSCVQKDIALSGGQGAPIAVTNIQVKALPVINEDKTESIRPEFVITVKDVGGGYLIGPDSLSLASACFLKGISKEESNAVRINAYLLKTKLQCGQSSKKELEGLVKLQEGTGEVVCTIPDSDLANPIYASTQNFQTSLAITLTYLYKSSISKDIEIQRLTGNTPAPPIGVEPGKVSGYAYQGDQLVKDASGKAMTWCAYYAQHPAETPEPYKNKINTDYRCACDALRCQDLRLHGGGDCVFSLPFCNGDTFCCTDTVYTPPTTSGGTSTTGDAGGAGDGTTPVPEDTITVTAEGKLQVNSKNADVAATVANINKYNLYPIIQSASAQYGVPEAVLLSIFTIESRGNPNADTYSPGKKNPEPFPGAAGIGQFRAPAAMDMGLCDSGCATRDERKNPQKAIPASAKYLKRQHDSVKTYTKTEYGRWQLSAGAYFRGLGCIQGAYKVASAGLLDPIMPTAGAILVKVPQVCKDPAGINSISTTTYVSNFNKYYAEYGGSTQ